MVKKIKKKKLAKRGEIKLLTFCKLKLIVITNIEHVEIHLTRICEHTNSLEMLLIIWSN